MSALVGVDRPLVVDNHNPMAIGIVADVAVAADQCARGDDLRLQQRESGADTLEVIVGTGQRNADRVGAGVQPAVDVGQRERSAAAPQSGDAAELMPVDADIAAIVRQQPPRDDGGGGIERAEIERLRERIGCRGLAPDGVIGPDPGRTGVVGQPPPIEVAQHDSRCAGDIDAPVRIACTATQRGAACIDAGGQDRLRGRRPADEIQVAVVQRDAVGDGPGVVEFQRAVVQRDAAGRRAGGVLHRAAVAQRQVGVVQCQTAQHCDTFEGTAMRQAEAGAGDRAAQDRAEVQPAPDRAGAEIQRLAGVVENAVERQRAAAEANAVEALQRRAAVDDQRPAAADGDAAGVVERRAAEDLQHAAGDVDAAGVVEGAVVVIQPAGADGDAAGVVERRAAEDLQHAAGDVDAAGVVEGAVVVIQPAGADIDRPGVDQRVAGVVGVVRPVPITEEVGAAVDVNGEAAAQGQRVAAVVAGAGDEGVCETAAEVQRRIVQRLAVQYRDAAVPSSRQVDAARVDAVRRPKRQAILDEQGLVSAPQRQHALVGDPRQRATTERRARALDHTAGDRAVQ